MKYKEAYLLYTIFLSNYNDNNDDNSGNRIDVSSISDVSDDSYVSDDRNVVLQYQS
jgi:hypothetical protein